QDHRNYQLHGEQKCKQWDRNERGAEAADSQDDVGDDDDKRRKSDLGPTKDHVCESTTINAVLALPLASSTASWPPVARFPAAHLTYNRLRLAKVVHVQGERGSDRATVVVVHGLWMTGAV